MHITNVAVNHRVSEIKYITAGYTEVSDEVTT